MAPVIRVDDEVWQWLKSQARPLEDTPNSVLRRVAGLDDGLDGQGVPERPAARGQTPAQARIGRRVGVLRERTNSGRNLNESWKVGARHALYHKDGNYYNHLRYFPGALFDPNGYVLFETESDYRNSPYIQRGEQLHVPGGISGMPSYVRKR
jgi:hypothetical protein